LSVSGKLAPETLNPAPEIAAEFTVSAPEPVEESVIVCVVAAFTFTLPKLRLEVLTFSVGTDAPNESANVSDTPPAVAVRFIDCAVDTVETVAEKLAVAEPAATVTDVGTVTAELLLARLTANAFAAAAFSVTVQASVPGPVIDEFVHESAVSTGTPVPLKPTAVEAPDEELLVNVNVPEAAPAAVGSN
jgi:hypothetical protein